MDERKGIAVWRRVLHWVFPQTCFHCAEDLGESDPGPLCPGCLATVEFLGTSCCQSCGIPLPDGGAHCYSCRDKRSKALKRIRAAVLYGPAVRSVLHAFKYESRRHLAGPLGDWLAAALGDVEGLEGSELLVPVPLHPRKLRERGFNQSMELALVVSKGMRLGVQDALVRVRATRPQADLGREERRRNVESAFGLAKGADVKDRKVFLIDDLATTGATLEACAQGLKQAGAREVHAFVMARQILKDAAGS